MDNTNGSSSDVEMENGHNTTNGCFKNGNSNIHELIDGDEEEMGEKNFDLLLTRTLLTSRYVTDVDGSPGCVKSSSNKSGVERMLEFGRELFQMSQRLEKENGINETNQKTLEVSQR